MTKVILVPGLQGQAQLENTNNTIGPNEGAVQRAASETECSFQKLRYQSKNSINPILSDMELAIARQINEVIKRANGEHLIIVGSSVGFGVTVGALSRLDKTTSPIALIGFKPVPDPLLAIELQINNPDVITKIKDGSIPKAPMPVESINGIQDVFYLSAQHLNDKQATRILTNDFDVVRFNKAMGVHLEPSMLIYGAKDHLTPSAHMSAFANAVHAVQTELVALDGTHASDFTDRLYQEVHQMVARFK